MKTFLRILLGFFVIIIIIVVIGFFLPAEVHLEKSLLVRAPRKVVFDQVNNLRNWENWSPWHQMDTTMKIEYSQDFIGTGASFKWEGNNEVGSGTISIIKSYPYDTIFIEMDFMNQGTSLSYHVFTETDSGTYVNWGFSTNLGKNPLSRYFGLMTDKFVGRDFEKGLKNLDSFSTGLPDFVVEIKKIKSFNYVSLRKKCKWEDVSSVMADSYAKLMKHIRSSKINMTGAPYSIYHTVNESGVDIEMGIPVNKAVKGKKEIVTGIFPDKKVASVDYYGFYDQLEKAHGYIQNWLTKMDYDVDGLPMEQYITDTSSEPDTSKWLTRIYYPVK